MGIPACITPEQVDRAIANLPDSWVSRYPHSLTGLHTDVGAALGAAFPPGSFVLVLPQDGATYSVTFAGECPGCGTTVLATGAGSPELIRQAEGFEGTPFKLGAEVELTCFCEATVPARCAAISVDPLRVTLADDDPDPSGEEQ